MQPVSGEKNYYAFDIFLRDLSKSDDDKALQIGADSFIKCVETGEGDTTGSYNANTYGTQNCVRVAFALYEDKIDSRINEQADILNALCHKRSNEAGRFGSNDPKYIKNVAIWEPNSNSHVPEIVRNNNILKLNNDVWQALQITSDPPKFLSTTKVPTHAVKNGIANNSIIEDIWDWREGSGVGHPNELKKQLSLQTEGNTVAETTVLPSSIDSNNDFEIPANNISRVRIYIWLEGQDVDSTNWASFGEGIDMNLILEKVASEI